MRNKIFLMRFHGSIFFISKLAGNHLHVAASSLALAYTSYAKHASRARPAHRRGRPSLTVRWRFGSSMLIAPCA